MKGGAFLWPRGFTIEAYRFVLESEYIWIAYRNSVFITVIGTAAAVLFTATTSYPLVKSGLPARKAFLYGILFTLLFNGGIIPTYLLVKGVGLLNSLWALILPNAVSAFNVIIMMSFFRTIPAELEESAMIDGANPIRTFFQIILPLSKPVLATIAVWEAVGLWNNYLQAIFYLNDKSSYILPVLLKDIIQGQELAQLTGEITGSSTDSVIAATIILAIIPIICVYPFLQKYFVKGTLIGSVKG
ncbi:carbohydrate ABC transporter permease [Paenibacillus sp.]|uniref:carbohydrate ABC transporter permease n=1 Tax=Paenibacillus sp. TaxID=58172 RepID=UPI002810F863|nr:carbohydrate ABC transporter permease [Paenibacillus sp.]